jgi:GTP-binding protein HflX
MGAWTKVFLAGGGDPAGKRARTVYWARWYVQGGDGVDGDRGLAANPDGGGRRLLVLGVASRPLEADPEVAAYYAELDRLVDSAGGVVVERRVQVRARPDPRTYVGPGFLAETARALEAARERGEGGVDGVVVAEEVAPRVLAELGERLPVPVEDRTRLILGIFAHRARSAEGRLQVELARLAYELPRLAGSRRGLSRQGGGIGVRGGAGESALELDRRRLRRRIAQLRLEVARLREERAGRRLGRGELPRVALVGYTNAGKTTLLAALAGRDDEGGRDRLFDTLDPTTRRIHHSAFGEALAVDTVGFVRNLPPGLVEAFEATLAEVREADLLLHVVDATSPAAQGEVEAVRAILERIDATDVPEILVATHAAAGAAAVLAAGLPASAVPVDSPTGSGLDVLCQRIGERLAQGRQALVVDIPADRWDVVAFARRFGPVELEEREDGGVRLVARLTAQDAARVRRRLAHG